MQTAQKKAQQTEAMVAFSGNQEVLDRILLKQKLLKENNPAHAKIRPVLLLPGGGQSGVIEAGVAVALEKLGLSEVFDYVVGISTGAAVGYYFLAKETAVGSTIYFDDNVRNKMVSFLHPWKLFDIDTLEKVFRNLKPITFETLRQNRTTLLIGVTELKTGKGIFLDAKSYEDPLSCMVASASLPILAGGKTKMIDGKKYLDGSLSFPLPVNYVIEGLQATDVLVVMPQTLEKLVTKGKVTKLLLRTVTHILTPTLQTSIEQYDQHFNESLAYLTGEKEITSGVRIATIHGATKQISALSMDPEELKKGVFAGEELTLALFVAAKKRMPLSLWEKIGMFFKKVFSR